MPCYSERPHHIYLKPQGTSSALLYLAEEVPYSLVVISVKIYFVKATHLAYNNKKLIRKRFSGKIEFSADDAPHLAFWMIKY